MNTQTSTPQTRVVPLVSVEERLLLQAVENLKNFVPGGAELFDDICEFTRETLCSLQSLPPATLVEFAVKREVARLARERNSGFNA
jgi:hypothetical protein